MLLVSRLSLAMQGLGAELGSGGGLGLAGWREEALYTSGVGARHW